MSKVVIKELRKSFVYKDQETVALDGVNLEVSAAEFLGIVGPNGCGKSTLLRIIAGIEAPTSGSVEFLGFGTPRPVTPLIFQNDTLLPWRDVESNVRFVPEIRRAPKPLWKKVADYFIGRAGLKGLETRYPFQLSGGYRRKTEIARALAAEEQILLMDEPLRSLDAIAKTLMHEEILKVREQMNKGIILVTHDIQEAVLLCDTVAVLTARPGRIKSIVRVDIPRPRSLDSLSHPLYLRVVKQIWDLLRPEAEKAMADFPEEERRSSRSRRSRYASVNRNSVIR